MSRRLSLISKLRKICIVCEGDEVLFKNEYSLYSKRCKISCILHLYLFYIILKYWRAVVIPSCSTSSVT